MSETSKKLKAIADEEQILNERIRRATAPVVEKAVLVSRPRWPHDGARDRRAKTGSTR